MIERQLFYMHWRWTSRIPSHICCGLHVDSFVLPFWRMLNWLVKMWVLYGAWLMRMARSTVAANRRTPLSLKYIEVCNYPAASQHRNQKSRHPIDSNSTCTPFVPDVASGMSWNVLYGQSNVSVGKLQVENDSSKATAVSIWMSLWDYCVKHRLRWAFMKVCNNRRWELL